MAEDRPKVKAILKLAVMCLAVGLMISVTLWVLFLALQLFLLSLR